MSILTKSLLCLLATFPAAYATSVLQGDTSGNTRGADSVDIQSKRSSTAPTQVASGVRAIAVGQSNTTSGSDSASFGVGNDTSGSESASVGLYNIASGLNASSFGLANEVTSDGGIAFGLANYIHGGPGVYWDQPSGGFGYFNTINVGADGSYAFGMNNTVSTTGATALGNGIANSTASSVMIGPSDSAKVTILSSGNVGIGLGNTSPTEKLHVAGNIKLTGSLVTASGTLSLPTSGTLLATSGSGSTTRLLVGGTTTPASAWQGTTVIGAEGQNKVIAGYLSSITNGAIIGGHNSALNAWADLNLAGQNLIFRTNGELERMRINSSGNVGIGTTSPSAKLDINGPSGVTAFTGATRLGLTVRGSINNSDYSGIDFSGNSGGSGDTPTARIAAIFTTGGSKLQFGTSSYYAGGVTTTAMTIDPAGNVGIGTTSPSAKLDVSGDAKISGSLTVGGATVLTTTGNGSGLTGLNATQLTTGTLPVARLDASVLTTTSDVAATKLTGTLPTGVLPTSVVQLDSTQTLTNKTLTGAKLAGTTVIGGSSSSTQLVVDESGGVGIGTAVPGAGTKLDVNGAVQVSGNVTLKNVGTAKSVIRISPAGDIPMIASPQGINPNPEL